MTLSSFHKTRHTSRAFLLHTMRAHTESRLHSHTRVYIFVPGRSNTSTWVCKQPKKCIRTQYIPDTSQTWSSERFPILIHFTLKVKTKREINTDSDWSSKMQQLSFEHCSIATHRKLLDAVKHGEIVFLHNINKVKSNNNYVSWFKTSLWECTVARWAP